MSKSADGCKPVFFYFKQSKTLDKVTNAEVLFTRFLLEQNLPFEAASHAGHFFFFLCFQIVKLRRNMGVLRPKQQQSTMPIAPEHDNVIQ